MDKYTLLALRKSIQHWEDNILANDVDDASIYSSDCALCAMFVDETGSCDGCPIYEFTGIDSCDNTPYEKTADLWNKWKHNDTKQNLINFKIAAIDEYKFLKSVLRAGNKK